MSVAMPKTICTGEVPANLPIPRGTIFDLAWKSQTGDGPIVKGEASLNFSPPTAAMHAKGTMKVVEDFFKIFGATAAAVWPHFSELREYVEENLSQVRGRLDGTVENSNRIDRIEKILEPISKFLNVILPMLMKSMGMENLIDVEENKEEGTDEQPDYYR